jgi:hypothetical protein
MALIPILFVTAAASFSLPTRRPTSGANFYPIANSSMSASRKTAPASRSILPRARRPTPRLARWSGKVLVARFAGVCDARWRRSWPFPPADFSPWSRNPSSSLLCGCGPPSAGRGRRAAVSHRLPRTSRASCRFPPAPGHRRPGEPKSKPNHFIPAIQFY